MTAARTLPPHPRVAVVGATGVVGRVMLDILHERAFPASEVVAVASERSAGRRVSFGDGTLVVQALGDGVAVQGIPPHWNGAFVCGL